MKIIIILYSSLLFMPLWSKAQNTFDSNGECLNVVDFTIAQPMGSYGDRIYSVTYQHEVFVNKDEWRAALGAIVSGGLDIKQLRALSC